MYNMVLYGFIQDEQVWKITCCILKTGYLTWLFVRKCMRSSEL